MADKAAGERLSKVLRVAMAQAGISSWAELGTESDVSPSTIDNWVYGLTTPRSAALGKVAKRLYPYTSAAELERAWFGLPPLEPPILDVLKELVPELRELVTVLRAQADAEILQAVRETLAERRRSTLGELPARRDEPPTETRS